MTLTANGSRDEHGAGVDLYVEKPVSAGLLQAKCNRLSKSVW